MKTIIISTGKQVLVDDNDYDDLMQWKWTFIPARNEHRIGYAARYVNDRPIYMHRQIMNCPKGLQVDHINGNGLDNRRENLRLASQSQNFANRQILPKRDIPYRGVYAYKDRKDRWYVNIKIHGKAKHVGFFKDIKEAAMAYDRAAKEQFGEFAILNFPECNHKLKGLQS